MKQEEDPKTILTEKIDEEILSRMPIWFQRLRNAYLKRRE